MNVGRRSADLVRRSGPETWLAVALPLLLLLGLGLAAAGGGTAGEPTSSQPPAETALTDAVVACPGAPGGAPVDITTDGEASGEVEVAQAGDRSRRPVSAGRVTTVRVQPGPVVIEGRDAMAPGLAAGRATERPLAAADCAAPQPEQWFTGVGAGAELGSVLELVNPNPGPAVADVTVLGRTGQLDVDGLRGITVPGRSSTRLELSQVAPQRGDLALRVVTTRGRLGVGVHTRIDEVGAGLETEDWHAGQTEPATANVLLGLARGTGERTLVLANPGQDEVRAEVRLLSERSAFAPEGLEPVAVPPGSVVTVGLDDVVGGAGAEDVLGVLVDSTGPVTASLRQVVDDDLSVVSAVARLDGRTLALVPPGRSRLLVADATAAGVVTVQPRDAGGKELRAVRVEVRPGTAATVDLPAGAASASVTPENTEIAAALLATGDGHAVVPLRELVRTGLVPDVRPGLP